MSVLSDSSAAPGPFARVFCAQLTSSWRKFTTWEWTWEPPVSGQRWWLAVVCCGALRRSPSASGSLTLTTTCSPPLRFGRNAALWSRWADLRSSARCRNARLVYCSCSQGLVRLQLQLQCIHYSWTDFVFVNHCVCTGWAPALWIFLECCRIIGQAAQKSSCLSFVKTSQLSF